MSRIKGRYVAQIIFEMEIERTENTLPLEEARKTFSEITKGIEETLKTCFEEKEETDFCKMTVIPQLTDMYEVEDNG